MPLLNAKNLLEHVNALRQAKGQKPLADARHLGRKLKRLGCRCVRSRLYDLDDALRLLGVERKRRSACAFPQFVWGRRAHFESALRQVPPGYISAAEARALFNQARAVDSRPQYAAHNAWLCFADRHRVPFLQVKGFRFYKREDIVELALRPDGRSVPHGGNIASIPPAPPHVLKSKEWISYKEFAAIAGIHHTTVYKRIVAGDLMAYNAAPFTIIHIAEAAELFLARQHFFRNLSSVSCNFQN